MIQEYLSQTLSRTKNQLSRLQNGELRHRLYFLHIPKCGGTSFVQAIRSHYHTLNPAKELDYYHLDPYAAIQAADALGIDHLAFQRNISLYFLAQDFEYVYGHFTFSNKAYELFHDKYKFVTLLRDPVKKWISLYFYNRYKKSDFFRVSDDLHAFLETETARGYGCDYAMQFAGKDVTYDFCSQEAIDTAVANLKLFHLVGKLEEMTTFITQFEHIFGLKLKIKHNRKNPVAKDERNKLLTPEVLEKIEKICRPNMEIYQSISLSEHPSISKDNVAS